MRNARPRNAVKQRKVNARKNHRLSEYEKEDEWTAQHLSHQSPGKQKTPKSSKTNYITKLGTSQSSYVSMVDKQYDLRCYKYRLAFAPSQTLHTAMARRGGHPGVERWGWYLTVIIFPLFFFQFTYSINPEISLEMNLLMRRFCLCPCESVVLGKSEQQIHYSIHGRFPCLSSSTDSLVMKVFWRNFVMINFDRPRFRTKFVMIRILCSVILCQKNLNTFVTNAWVGRHTIL